jgi:hypothetical protein
MGILRWFVAASSAGAALAETCSSTFSCDDPAKPVCCQMREDIYTCIDHDQVCCPQSFSHGYGAVCSGAQQCCWGFSILSCYDNATEICCSGNYAAACPKAEKCGGSTQYPQCVNATDGGDEVDEADDSESESAAFMADYYRRRGAISWVDEAPPSDGVGASAGAIDWVAKGAVTPATSQGRCATCQDFSAIADVEGAWFRSGHPLTKLSEQELIDCGGGNQYGMGWIQGNGGVANIEHAPLANHSDKNLTGCRGITDCSAAKQHKDAYINGSTCLTNHEEDKILALLQHGPMSVSINASPLNGYRGGIINCS